MKKIFVIIASLSFLLVAGSRVNAADCINPTLGSQPTCTSDHPQPCGVFDSNSSQYIYSCCKNADECTQAASGSTPSSTSPPPSSSTTLPSGCQPKDAAVPVCSIIGKLDCGNGICCDSQADCQKVNPPTQQTGGTDKIRCTPPGGEERTGVQTAIGCIPFGDTSTFAGFFLKWAVGIGGGIAFLLTLYAGFMIMTSSGNPERLKAGQELLTSALAGIIMIIFSVFLLRLIGVNILGIFK